jgi:hypothetical protein
MAGKDSPTDFLDFLPRFLQENYFIVGGYVSNGETGRWLEPLPKDQIAELLLFERKAAR